jgi:hypothetical protein
MAFCRRGTGPAAIPLGIHGRYMNRFIVGRVAKVVMMSWFRQAGCKPRAFHNMVSVDKAWLVLRRGREAKVQKCRRLDTQFQDGIWWRLKCDCDGTSLEPAITPQK